ncbi:alpha-N-arabinofuranosidase [Arthrobacter zhaoxinii]|uniref:non-reducing end alpha-L-arabinofuranosidase n=1 Tax=Arthrobacter zhaoxinii TaxID=2964616 RepID=A0ABY5YVQ6_9MICC|nr:alpha-N-arabinofuranosidase [Arthrobacter zhaoxinii]UWX97725.1 alpha-N-arabinofuranosidase [Arthrobacter zhaoxinii]
MPNVRLTLDPHFSVGPVSRRVFGSFVEHLGRSIYGGIYEPEHYTANDDGFRRDVIDLVRELGISTVRYPGGNFVSGYRWEDGVGPRQDRPSRLDLAWHSIESNDVGLDEFARWVTEIGGELMYAVNLGTRGVQEALDVLEYANIPAGTALSDRRVANGSPLPHNIRIWCLGNEMDGPWQLGHGTATEYARLAGKTARAMRQLDPALELVVCGSSSAAMPTFGEWERTVLTETYEDVDFISCHAYYEPQDGDFSSFLASAVSMDRFIDSVVASADHVKAVRGSDKTMYLSFDEWNVWYQSQYNDGEKITDAAVWPQAPRLLENAYSAMDAVVVGGLLISLLRHADRVTAASLAQLVNVIAPIMTEQQGPAWRQTTFYPFSITSRLARGTVLDPKIDSPSMHTDAYGQVPMVDAVATHDEATGNTSVFLVNRSLSEAVTISIDAGQLGIDGIQSAETLHHEDFHAANTLQDQDRVVPEPNKSAYVDNGTVTVTLPPVSWTALALN